MERAVAITGATGFLGRHVYERLRRQGVPARLLVRDPARIGTGDAETVAGDLGSDAALAALCAGASAVIHCAGRIAAADRAAYEAVNVEGTRRLAAAAARAGVRRFIHVSSLAAREPGLSPYGASKRAGEDALVAAAGRMSWVIVRPPAAYGPGDRATLPLIGQLTRRRALVPGRRDSRASLIYAEDLAGALAALLEAGAPEGSIHELHDGTDRGYSWAELTAIAGKAQGTSLCVSFLPEFALAALAHAEIGWSRITGRSAALTPGKVRELYHRDWVCRNALLDACSSWKPRVRFAEGFPNTLAWYRRSGWLPPRPGRSKSRIWRAGNPANEGNEP